MKLAVYHGDLTLLQEHEKEFEPDAEVFYNACAGGNLEALKWLRSEGCPWDEGTFAAAAERGHLEVVKWLRSEGCPRIDREACAVAAEHGHLEVVKWLRSEGCPRIDRE